MIADLSEPILSPPKAGSQSRASSATAYIAVHLVLVPGVLFVAAWLVQHGPLDLAFASAFFDPAAKGFNWRSSLLLNVLGHQAARALPIVVAAVSIVAWALSYQSARVRPWRGILLATGCAMLLGPTLINWMKANTSEHCPSDIFEFGGVVSYAADRAAPFWAATKESAGHCLPSGHAGGGYALLCLYFAGWASGRPEWRWSGLAIGIGAGLIFSLVRMMQGAHFASATLWSAAIDWTVCALVFFPLLCRPAQPER